VIRGGHAEIVGRRPVGDLSRASYTAETWAFYNIARPPTVPRISAVGAKWNTLRPPDVAHAPRPVGRHVGTTLTPPISPTERVAVDGAFKVPSVRNVELTGPYFHNGGKATLEQVVDFYSRGGDFHEANIDNLDQRIRDLGLSATDKANLVAFLNPSPTSGSASRRRPSIIRSSSSRTGHASGGRQGRRSSRPAFAATLAP